MDEDSRVSALSEPFAIDAAAAATELSDEDDGEEFFDEGLLAAASSGSVPESSRWRSIDFIISVRCSVVLLIPAATLGLCVAFLSCVTSLLL